MTHELMKKLLLILLCLPALAHGQTRTVLCSNNSGTASSITCVAASGVTAGTNLILPFIEDSLTTQSISGCGTSPGDWKIATQQPLFSDSGAIYYAENVTGAAGPCTITMTLGASENHLSIAAIQYTGLLTALSFDSLGLSRFDGTPTTLTGTAQNTGELVVSLATTGCNGSPGTFSSTTGSSLVVQVNNTAGGNAFGFFDTLAASAGSQSVQMQTPTPQCGYGTGMIASFRYALPPYGRVQQAISSCSTTTCSATLPSNALAGDLVLVQPMHNGCNEVSVSSSGGELMRNVPAGSGCETTPMYFISNGGPTTVNTTITSGHLTYLVLEELTSNLHYWNGSGYAINIYSTPLTTYNITGTGTCYLVAPYNLRQAATTASSGFWPFTPAPTGTGNYPFWEGIKSSGGPYSNVADIPSGINTSVIAGLYSFCSDPSPTPQALQAAWNGPGSSFSTQNSVTAGHALIVHNVADHTAVTWTLTSSPSNTWVQIGGCGVSDYFCDWIAWSAASGITTFTVPAASWQTLYQEVSGIASLRHSVYTAPATGSTSYTTGTVSATAGDYLLAFDSCQGGFTNCTPSGQNSANTWTLRNDGSWTDNTGNQAFDQIAPSTTTYALPFTLPSTGYNASSSIYDFVASPNIGIRTQMFGSAQSFGNTQAIP